MGRIAGTVKVTIGFDNEDVLTEDSFYTKMTPRISVGVPRFKQDQIKLAIIENNRRLEADSILIFLFLGG